MIPRRRFLASASALAAGAALPASALPSDTARLDDRAGDVAPVPTDGAPLPDLTAEDVGTAAHVQGLEFTAADRELMLPDVIERLDSLAAIRDAEPPNSVPPLRPWCWTCR